MKVLVVTGGIGSGKSEVCRILHDRYGIQCYDADAAVKELYRSDGTLLDSIEDALGRNLRDDEGNLRPQLLAECIFTSDASMNTVEGLVFPALEEHFRQWKSFQKGKFVVFESATVLEKPYFDGFGDIVIVVDAPFVLRLSRAARRDSRSENEVLSRMNVQKLMNRISDGFCDPRVDYLLRNDSDMEELVRRVDMMMEKLNK
ncbi:MAG: dephospho-CoA kinase [Bacteroidales bacterium]|nr:dephospho-CoA kinase [Bacteroidales bacterium]